MKIESLSFLKKQIADIIQQKTTIGIVTHKKPDGDGLGASFALQEILLEFDHSSDIILEEQIPKLYSFLDGEKRTTIFNKDLKYETLFVLDCHEKNRLGICEPLVDKAKNVIVIDHHMENNVLRSDHFIDPSKVSVGAIIYKLFQDEILKMTQERALYIAQSIYVSILNDTNNFINSNTDEETFRICSELVKLGLKPGVVTKLFLMNKPAVEMKFLGQVLATIRTLYEDRVMFMNSSLQMLQDNGLDQSVNSKILSWVKGLKKVEIVVYFSEINFEEYKLSIRSENVNTNTIARKFGGGGHAKASGCTIKGNLLKVEDLILTEIKKQL